MGIKFVKDVQRLPQVPKSGGCYCRIGIGMKDSAHAVHFLNDCTCSLTLLGCHSLGHAQQSPAGGDDDVRHGHGVN